MHLRKFVVLFLALALGATVACRKPAKVMVTKDQRARIEENLLKVKPTPKQPIDAMFAENIRLIGIDLFLEQVKPGDPLTITYYWECLKETPGEWKIFGHFELPGGRRMLLDHAPMGELYPIAQWKKGDIIRDIQKVTIDAEAKPGVGNLWVGIFNEEVLRTQGGGDRMKLENKDRVTNDGDNRVRGAQVTVVEKDASATATATPTAVAPPPKANVSLKALQIQTPIVIDGKFDEPIWAKAVETPAFGTFDGKPADPASAATARVLYDDKNLYFAFHVLDKNIENPKKNRDEEVWSADAIEIYLDANADGHDYVELQFSPMNVIFDALFKEHRTPDWKEARKYTMQGLQSAVVTNGTANKPGDDDSFYDVEVAVPLASIPGLTLPLEKGHTLRANFFRIDSANGKVLAMYAYWPTGGDFHDLSKAGQIVFTGPEEQPVLSGRIPPANLKQFDRLRTLKKARLPSDRMPVSGAVK